MRRPIRTGRPLLLTGFEGFGDYPVNSSWEGVRWLDGRTIRGVPVVARQLAVEFKKVGPLLMKILDEVQPRAVIAFGLTPGRVVSIERVALNVAHVNGSSKHFTTTKDNVGYQPREEALDGNGPDLYWSSLPTDAIEKSIRHTLARMRTQIVPWISHSAGTFLCNAAFYYLAGWAARRRVPVGFIHVAPLRNSDDSQADRPRRFTHRQLRTVVEVIVRATGRGLGWGLDGSRSSK